jgi:hypothetical protein
MCLRWLPLALLAIFLTSSVAAETCSLDDVTAPELPPGSLEIGGQRITFTARARYSFEKSGEIVAVKETISADLSDFQAKWPAIFNSFMQPSSCERRYGPHGQTTSVLADGRLLAVGRVTYEQWSCGWTHWICCKGLKCRRCRAEFRNRWFQKTIALNTLLDPDVVGSSISIRTASTIDDRGGIADWIVNLTDIFTVGLGGKILEREFEKKIQGIRDSIPVLREQLDKPGSSDPTYERLSTLADLTLRNVYFSAASGKVEIVAESFGRLREGTACFIKKEIEQEPEVGK